MTEDVLSQLPCRQPATVMYKNSFNATLVCFPKLLCLRCCCNQNKMNLNLPFVTIFAVLTNAAFTHAGLTTKYRKKIFYKSMFRLSSSRDI